MTELLVGTKKGLIVLDGNPAGGEFELRCRAFPGEPVDFAMRDPASGRVIATSTSPFYGPKIWFADDPAGEWTQADGVSLPDGSDEALERIWVIVAGEGGALYAGGDPGVLFESRDGGETWQLNRALREHRIDDDWQPGGGGLCLHSIVPWPDEPDKLSLAVSAAGVWHTEEESFPAICLRTPPPKTALCACTAWSAPRAGPSAFSFSSTVASTAPTTAGRTGRRSAMGCPRTSASRWRSTRATPTART
jgi:hypothetical protein